MARIETHTDTAMDGGVLLEGFPGTGMVGKIAADHLAETLELPHYANVHCEGLPRAASYTADDRTLRTPVRIHADPAAGLAVLVSDVPVGPDAAASFADCLAGWLGRTGTVPVFVAGRGREESGDDGSDGSSEPALAGLATGGAVDRFDATDVPLPADPGVVSGPTGAMLDHAVRESIPALCVIADADPRFPDPTAAIAVLERVVAPLADVDVRTDALAGRADRIAEARDRLLGTLDDDDRGSRARNVGMYQ